jgi:hypothetical protein
MTKQELHLLLRGISELEKELKEGGPEYIKHLRQLAAEKEIKNWTYDEETDTIGV